MSGSNSISVEKIVDQISDYYQFEPVSEKNIDFLPSLDQDKLPKSIILYIAMQTYKERLLADAKKNGMAKFGKLLKSNEKTFHDIAELFDSDGDKNSKMIIEEGFSHFTYHSMEYLLTPSERVKSFLVGPKNYLKREYLDAYEKGYKKMNSVNEKYGKKGVLLLTASAAFK